MRVFCQACLCTYVQCSSCGSLCKDTRKMREKHAAQCPRSRPAAAASLAAIMRAAAAPTAAARAASQACRAAAHAAAAAGLAAHAVSVMHDLAAADSIAAATFIDCPSFEGARPGYDFKKGPYGLGYYSRSAQLPAASTSTSDAALAGLPPEAEEAEEEGSALAALAREDREADQQADLAAFLGSSHRHGSHRADSLPADGLRTPPPEEIRMPQPDWSDVLELVEGEAGCSDADSDGSHSDY